MMVLDVLERNGYAAMYEVVQNGIAWDKRKGYDILSDKKLLHSVVKNVMHCAGSFIRMEVQE